MAVRRGSAPRCWWCHDPIDLDNPWRGEEPSLELPLAVGVHVCGPDCSGQPDGAIIYTHESLTGYRE